MRETRTQVAEKRAKTTLVDARRVCNTASVVTKYAITLVLAATLVGCATDDEPQIRSEVSSITVTSTELHAAGVLTQDEHQDFEFVRPDENGMIHVLLDLSGDMGLYSNDGTPVDLAQSDCVDETTDDSKGCFYVTADGIVYVELYGFAPVSEYTLAIVFKGIGTTP